ncbi:MAG TPA: DsbA family protein [Oxalobacteraceae bacterium]|jgi:putative protein-disulfide isomerase|nr:DsbA family protein [Oxalobacteraceae bacterium]HCN88304.1 DsbA family protein [Oxalobacteraceae bacterium]
MATLIYIADPMCSWCYGFGPELTTLLNGLPEVPLEIIVGGLRANNTNPMDEELKTVLRSHWSHVRDATGLPFSDQALSHPGFIYDTEPACRAVVAARLLAPTATLQVFHAIQHAFYADALNVTQGEVLAQVASAALTNAGFPIDAETFGAKWAAAESVAATHDDFIQTQRWGVTGFPTLVLDRNGRLDLITAGFVRTEALVARMQAVIDEPV